MAQRSTRDEPGLEDFSLVPRVAHARSARPVNREDGPMQGMIERARTMLISTVARSGQVTIAHAALEATIAAYPDRRITLQDRAMVLRDSRLKVLPGAKR